MYKSQVTDIHENGEVEIAMPIENGRVHLLPLGVRYAFVFYTCAGVYHCIGRIKERCKRDNIYVLLVEFHSPLGRYQRRQYYRYPCLINAWFYIVGEKAVEGNPEEALHHLRDDRFYEKQQRCKILDISGGGVRMVSEENLKVGGCLLLILRLTNEQMDEQHYIIGRVIMSEALKEYPGQYQARVQFVIKDNKVREEIIRYIFEEERKDIRIEG